LLVIRSAIDLVHSTWQIFPDHIGKGWYNESLDERVRIYDGGCDKRVVAPISLNRVASITPRNLGGKDRQ
jgi:hypothetical protein